jgi:hypothetical protein
MIYVLDTMETLRNNLRKLKIKRYYFTSMGIKSLISMTSNFFCFTSLIGASEQKIPKTMF